MDSLVPVILNGVIIVLLCAAIVFGIRLHRRLVALQSAQSEFAALLGRLDGALVQASSTVSALKYNAARQLEPSLPRPVTTATLTPRPAADRADPDRPGRDDQDRPEQGRGGEAGAAAPPPLGRQPDRRGKGRRRR
jgi:hypothetical protein